MSSENDHAITLLRDLADTSWRMLIPTGLLAAGGILADLRFDTAPWITLTTVPVGLAISVLLVRRQLRRVKG